MEGARAPTHTRARARTHTHARSSRLVGPLAQQNDIDGTGGECLKSKVLWTIFVPKNAWYSRRLEGAWKQFEAFPKFCLSDLISEK